MTVVDVNTGKFTGSGGNLEETVTKNNLEAAEEMVRQLRLRDIGGIIVIDFIDMVLESNRDLVLRRLVECLGRDRTRHQVAEVTSLGLVQMTRKRIGTGLLEAFSETCEHCQGRGLLVQHEPVEPRKQQDEEPRRGRRGRGRGAPATRATTRQRQRWRQRHGARRPSPSPKDIAAMARHEHKPAEDEPRPTQAAADEGPDAAGAGSRGRAERRRPQPTPEPARRGRRDDRRSRTPRAPSRPRRRRRRAGADAPSASRARRPADRRSPSRLRRPSPCPPARAWSPPRAAGSPGAPPARRPRPAAADHGAPRTAPASDGPTPASRTAGTERRRRRAESGGRDRPRAGQEEGLAQALSPVPVVEGGPVRRRFDPPGRHP